MKRTDPKVLTLVYDLLVSIGGAREEERESFIDYHSTTERSWCEWRFCGHLGFGGKFRFDSFTVDCYKEDETPKRVEIIRALNSQLFILKDQLGV